MYRQRSMAKYVNLIYHTSPNISTHDWQSQFCETGQVIIPSQKQKHTNLALAPQKRASFFFFTNTHTIYCRLYNLIICNKAAISCSDIFLFLGALPKSFKPGQTDGTKILSVSSNNFLKSPTAIAGHVQAVRCYAELLVWCKCSVEQRKMHVQDSSTLFYA